MRYFYAAFAFILAIGFWFKGEDMRSDIYTAAAFIMMYIEFRGK